ncbi:adenosylmethionine decarboxylase [Candidatus Woesearchaeota archaeon]|nr:adenosylmethionine decarboxylase [Candidatus Woesearchaeota archaeon]
MTETFGPHLTFDARGCDKAKLTDQNFVYRLLNEMPELIGMTKISLPYVVEWLDKWATTPGYTGFVILAESHISLHTFPDSEYIFIDIFSCREFNVDKAMDYLITAFNAKHVTTNVVQRGLDFPRGEKESPKIRVSG